MAFSHGTADAQKSMGVMPDSAHLSPSNPGVQAWESLGDDARRVFARMMEVYAGFLTHTDHQIGRLVAFLEQAGRLDNTIFIVTSDNGASGDGGPEGTMSEGLLHNDLSQRLSDAIPHLNELGGPNFYNNYPWGWAQAGNTPFRWYKQFTHADRLHSWADLLQMGYPSLVLDVPTGHALFLGLGVCAAMVALARATASFARPR